MIIEHQGQALTARDPAAREALRQADAVETMLRGIVPVIRGNDLGEAERLRDMDYTGFHSIAPWRNPEENAAQLARFLDVAPETALELARTEYLFSD